MVDIKSATLKHTKLPIIQELETTEKPNFFDIQLVTIEHSTVLPKHQSA